MIVTALNAVPAVALAGAVTLKWSGAAALTLMVAVPVRLGEVAVAVRLLEPAANRVAYSVVVLTPFVNDTALIG